MSVMDYDKQALLNEKTNANITNSLFRGTVENNVDPRKLGRVQVRIPSLYDSNMSTEDLPWAIPSVPTAGPDHGSVMIPEVGDTVFVLFEDGRKDKPVYIGCTYSGSTSIGKVLKSEGEVFSNSDHKWNEYVDYSELPNEYLSGNGGIKVIYKSPKGACIYIDERDGNESVNIVDCLGQIIRMSSPTNSETNANGSNRRRYGNVADNTLVKGNVPGEGSILLEINSNDELNNVNSKILLEKGTITITNGNNAPSNDLNGSQVILKDKTVEVTNFINSVVLDEDKLKINIGQNSQLTMNETTNLESGGLNITTKEWPTINGKKIIVDGDGTSEGASVHH